ncbi:glycosyltransferase family 4 protein [Nitrosomonas halophila]|uniref:Glycosyltransferase involved in cell wall bisynthesis n=1 Tax=Nitrosomonas halophila TaxID=44576 RepID=A0A1H3HTR6_9PROT|nr:glycosyltransferase family 4 protein [Nitrosomonas halophila]SDY18911.1 Glycosyltransferase involved in cell wall bisynthesis [Nitrosomonas halophila]
MKIILFANTDWYLYNFRYSLAQTLRDSGHEVLLVSPAGSYGERLRSLGFRWIPAPMERRSLNPLREVALILWLRRLIANEHVDLVHGFTIKCAIYGSLAARLSGVSARVNAVAGMGYVFTSNDLKARFLRPLVQGMMRLALDGADARLILQNPDDALLFKQARLVSPARVRLIPGSGVNCQRFERVSGVRNNKRLRVLLPARLLWDKGIAEYVEAAGLLQAAGREVDCLLAGDPDPGNPAAVPETTLRNWVDNGLIQWLGHVDDMPALYQSVDIVVLPSYREGLPKGLIEAAACALPLVTTDVPGCREVVTDGIDGLLIPVRDALALANAIARLQDDSEFASRIGLAAREKVLREFDERIVIKRTLEVYRELLPELC